MKKVLQNIGFAATMAAGVLGYTTQAQAVTKVAPSHSTQEYVTLAQKCSDADVFVANEPYCTQIVDCMPTPNAPQCTSLLDQKLVAGKEVADIVEPVDDCLDDDIACGLEDVEVIDIEEDIFGTDLSTSTKPVVSTKVSDSFDDLKTIKDVDGFINTYFNSAEDRKELLKIALDNAENTNWTIAPMIRGKAVQTPVFDSDSQERMYLMMQKDPKKGITSARKLSGTPSGSKTVRLNSQLKDTLQLKPSTIVQVIEDSWKNFYSCKDIAGTKDRRDEFKPNLSYEQRLAISKAKDCQFSLAATAPGLIQDVPNDIVYKGKKIDAQIVVDGKKIHNGDYIRLPIAKQIASSNGHILILENSAAAIRESAMLRSGLYNSSDVSVSNPIVKKIKETKENKHIKVLNPKGLDAIVDSKKDLVATATVLDPEGKPFTVENATTEYEVKGDEIKFYSNPQTVGEFTAEAILVDDKNFKTRVAIPYQAILPVSSKPSTDGVTESTDAITSAVKDYVNFTLGGDLLIDNAPGYAIRLAIDKNMDHLVLGGEVALGYNSKKIAHPDEIKIFVKQNKTDQGSRVKHDTAPWVEKSVKTDLQTDSNLNLSLGARAGYQFNDRFSIIGALGYERNSINEVHEGSITDIFDDERESSIGLGLNQTQIDHAGYFRIEPMLSGKKGWGASANYKLNTKGQSSVGFGLHKKFGDGYKK